MIKIGQYHICDNCIEAISDIREILSPRLPGETARETVGYSFNIYTKGGNKLEIFSEDFSYIKSQYDKVVSIIDK